MKLTHRQKELFEFVTKMHGDQKRKYTGEPYVNHCLEVAEIVSEFEEGCIEIALCHDLLEDTECTIEMLYKELLRLGYGYFRTYNICSCVHELTDIFTTENHPFINRKQRKIEETKRLARISFKAQSVKYADLIHNTKSIVEYDKGFAKVYLSEKNEILRLMNNGNSTLFSNCLKSLQNAMYELNLDI